MSSEPLLLLGGSSDIALALLDRLLPRDLAASAVAQCHSGADRLAPLVARYGDRLRVERCDLGDAADVAAFVERFRASYGTPGAVVQLAGLKLKLERFSKWDEGHFERDLRVQLLSTATVLRAFLPAMAKSARKTKVVFVLSSVTRGVPPKYLSMYTVVKSAQLGLMRALAAEYAGTSVAVNGVAPGMVATRFLSEIPEKAVEMAAARAAGKRLLAPSDVADVLDFLLSPASDHLSGVEIPITDGDPG